MKIKRKLYSTTLGQVNQLGLLDGRVKYYHATKNTNIPSIYKKGLLYSKSFEKDNWTSEVKGEKPKNKEGIVYLAKDKRTADNISKRMDKVGKGPSSVLSISIPYEDFKKIKLIENPHKLGASNFSEWKILAAKKYGFDLNNKKDQLRLKKAWKNIIEGTETIGQDLSIKYIKGSSNYRNNSIKESIDYIKSNPKRFIKGVGKSLKGTIIYPIEYYKDKKYYK